MAQQPRADPGQPTTDEVVHDDPAPRDAAHLPQERDRRGRVEMVEEQRRVRDVEGTIGEGERTAVPDVQLEPRRHPQAWLAHDRGGQDLGAAVDAGHPKVAAVPGGPGQEGGGDVGGTRADVEDGQGGAVSRQHADGPCRQLRRHRAIDWSARGRAGCHAGRLDRQAAHPAVPRHRPRASPEQATRRLPSGP